MKSWDKKGCKTCRGFWEQGKLLPLIILVCVNVKRHTTLYHCPDCGSYWEEHERFADIITKENVAKYYLDKDKWDDKEIDNK